MQQMTEEEDDHDHDLTMTMTMMMYSRRSPQMVPASRQWAVQSCSSLFASI